MIPRIQTGTSFKGAGLYYLHDKKREGETERLTTERVAWTHARNTMEVEPEAVLAEMRQTAFDQSLLKHLAGQRLDGRPTERTVMTVALAWAPDQAPTQKDMIAAGESFLTHMGWQEHQVLFVAHNDTKHPHVHLIINRVHPETGMTLDDTWSKRRSQRWALEYEREHGRIYCEAREAKYDRTRTGGPENMNYREWKEWQELSKDRIFDPAFRQSIEAGEWDVLKQAQRQERIAYWRETGQLRRALRASLREDVREEFADEWSAYAKLRDRRFENLRKQDRATRRDIGKKLRAGEPRHGSVIDQIEKKQRERYEKARTELAEMRKDISDRQRARLDQIAAPALEALSEERLASYRELLARHRAERSDLRGDQEQGVGRPDLLERRYGGKARKPPEPEISQPKSASPGDAVPSKRPMTMREKHDAFYKRRDEANAVEFGQEKAPREKSHKETRARAPRRGASDLVAGAGLSIIGKIADSLETLFDTPPPAKEQDRAMPDDRENIPQPKNPPPTQVDQELEARRKADLEFYLQQRARERGIDRGR